MIELPEAVVISRELKETVCGRLITAVEMNGSPHKFAFFLDDPSDYEGYLKGKSFSASLSYGGMIELRAEDYLLVFSDGVNLRFHEKDTRRPLKHQMLMEFSDGTALSASIQMYGGIWCFKEGTFQNEYREAAMTRPSPLSSDFHEEYFLNLISENQVQKLSAKAFLATEQRIPGLGNGVLQDLLWKAGIHPRRKVFTLSTSEEIMLYHTLKELLEKMVASGGRDTEKNLFGENGGYPARMSKLHMVEGCPACSGEILKETYMGGSIYFCPACQKLSSE